jgi:cell division inhibitor SepF
MGTGALKMQLLRPADFSEATRVADCLKAGQAVVLNLENMEERDARRLLDYVAGVLYAVDGKIERPAQKTFLLTPRGVSVASETVEQLRN